MGVRLVVTVQTLIFSLHRLQESKASQSVSHLTNLSEFNSNFIFSFLFIFPRSHLQLLSSDFMLFDIAF